MDLEGILGNISQPFNQNVPLEKSLFQGLFILRQFISTGIGTRRSLMLVVKKHIVMVFFSRRRALCTQHIVKDSRPCMSGMLLLFFLGIDVTACKDGVGQMSFGCRTELFVFTPSGRVNELCQDK